MRRPPVPQGCPSHVTLRLRSSGTPGLRTRRFLRELRPSLRRGCERRGMKAISARVARAAQRAFGLSGPVLHGRYQLRILRTPREVRRALAYVLLNARKHWKERHAAAPPERLDQASSGRWFDGWRRVPGSREPPPDALEEPEVAPPRTWLLSVGWRRHGLVDPAEVSGG